MSGIERGSPEEDIEQGAPRRAQGLTDLVRGTPAEEFMETGRVTLDGQYRAYMRWRVRKELSDGTIVPCGPEF